MAIRITADLRVQYCLLREDVSVPLAPLLNSNHDGLKSSLARALSVYSSARFRSTTCRHELLPLEAKS